MNEAHETRADLIAYFNQAGLPVSTTITERFNMDGSPAIVRLSVSERPTEHFMVDVGDHKNKVQVLSIDKNFKQLILSVKEPRREYKVPVPTKLYISQKNQLAEDLKKVKYETKYTDPTEQKYLMGMDEKHLFISGLPKENVKTVADAHQVLKHREVVKAEKEGRDVKRQGEYFFVPLTKVEEKEFMAKLKQEKMLRKTLRGRLQRMGHTPHYIRRLIVMRRGTKRYAQGHVTHQQHEPLMLPTWHRVYKNRETSSPGIRGFVD